MAICCDPTNSSSLKSLHKHFPLTSTPCQPRICSFSTPYFPPPQECNKENKKKRKEKTSGIEFPSFPPFSHLLFSFLSPVEEISSHLFISPACEDVMEVLNGKEEEAKGLPVVMPASGEETALRKKKQEEDKKKKKNTIPVAKGIPKSGRVWKGPQKRYRLLSPRSNSLMKKILQKLIQKLKKKSMHLSSSLHRSSSLNAVKVLHKTWQQKTEGRERLRLLKDKERAMKEEAQRKREEEKKLAEERRKRKEENEKKSSVVQVVSDPPFSVPS